MSASNVSADGWSKCLEVVRPAILLAPPTYLHDVRARLPCLALEHGRPDNKTIMASRSFGRTVETRREMEEALAFHTSRAAMKMRRQGLAACSPMVFLTTNRHDVKAAQYYGQQSVQLATASADTSRLVRAGLRGLADLATGLPLQKGRRAVPQAGESRPYPGRPPEPTGQFGKACHHGGDGPA